MEINKTKRLNNLQYYPTVNKKTMIFWHHTAGTNAQGAIDWWNQTPEHVGTAYVIDRDGTIFEVFEPNRWAYHLGVKGDDDYIEKASIGIELVAAGPVHLEKDGEFYFYPLWPNKIRPTKIKKEEVWDMGEEGWRDYQYYHSYTDAQIKSLIDLSNQLVSDFKIQTPANFMKLGFQNFNPDIYKKRIPGIWSHSSVRKDKNDIVPHPSFMKKVFDGLARPYPTQPIVDLLKPKPKKS